MSPRILPTLPAATASGLMGEALAFRHIPVTASPGSTSKRCAPARIRVGDRAHRSCAACSETLTGRTAEPFRSG
jgi:hypothetical protein